MKSTKFRGTTYYIGKKISEKTKKYVGFFFNKYHDIKNNEIHWYFVRIDTDWLSSKDYFIEYYRDLHLNMDSFQDSVDSEDFFYEKDGTDYEIEYYEAITLKDTLKKL